jgi:UDP-N-acetylglucosamine 2-epimerase (non-hydrolysing)
MKILSVFGTRPEAVKMAPVVQVLARTPNIDAKVCVTAQHREMLDQVLETFGIMPDIDLDLMRPNQSLADLSAAVFMAFDPVLLQERPDWVLVQGDTTTVMVASLVAYYRQIRVGHVEAGLRTGDKWQPFPEEINRRVAGVVADLHFAPTEWARQNLLREGVAEKRVVVTGNPVIDALQQVASRPATGELIDGLRRQLVPEVYLRANLPEKAASKPRLILITAHRRENFGRPLEQICEAIDQLAEKYRNEVHFIYPVHLNPNVQEPVYRLLGNKPNISLLPPLDYLPWVYLLKQASLILTDSGGLQEEAPGLGVPVLVMRAVTERPEGLQAGTVRLVGTDCEKIVAETCRLLDDQVAYDAMAQAVNPYGDGQAASRIVRALLEYSD